MLRYALSILLTIGLLSSSVFAQVLRGSITDENGKPVPAATVYVREAQLGTSADDGGNFELKLKNGTYNIVVQSLGYQTEKDVVKIAGKDVVLNVTLLTRAYEIPAVIISKNREDPAYRVMRHTIAMAPYYSNRVSSYTADVYLKGTGKVNKISRVVKTLAKKELKKAEIKEGETYLLESMNEISFTAPNTYSHRIISSQSTLPAELGGSFNTMNYVNVNVYMLNIFARDAFSNYRFSYEGFVEEGDLYISKIKVTPRKKMPELLRGYIYIIENTWQVYSGDLSGEFPFGTFSGIMSTNEVQDGVRLPTSYSFRAAVKALGNEANFEYAGTVRYKNVEVDKALENPLKKSSKKVVQPAPAQQTVVQKASATKSRADSIKQDKRRKELEKLLEKEELSNRDMHKASKLIAEEAEEVKPQSLNLSTTYQVQVDSGVRNRDTAYWNEIRPIPLKINESISFHKADSVRSIHADYDSAVDNERRSGWFGDLLLGKTYRPCSSMRIIHKGLIDPGMLYFNAVDGWQYGQELRLRKMFADSTTMSITGAAKWAFNREAFMWKLNGNYTYIPERRAHIFFNVGKYDLDLNNFNEETQLNGILALLLHKNYNRLYEHFTASIGNSIDITNGLTLRASFSYADRTRLENHTNFSFFNRDADYAPNIPENKRVSASYELHTASTVDVSLSYTPKYFYRMRGRQKRMAYSNYPTFTLLWREGIPTIFGSKSDFSFAKIAIRQTKSMGLLEELFYQVEGAKFFRNTRVDFADYYHFNMPGYVVHTAGSTWEYARYYRYSTPTWGASAELRYTTPFLALKYLPLLNNMYSRENVGAHVIYTPQQDFYTEINYSMSEILLVMKLGVFVGFENTSFRVVGINFAWDL